MDFEEIVLRSWRCTHCKRYVQRHETEAGVVTWWDVKNSVVTEHDCVQAAAAREAGQFISARTAQEADDSEYD